MTNHDNTTIQFPLAETDTSPAPFNGVTGKDYFGEMKQGLLQAAEQRNFSTDEWATMKQWNRAGQTIAKGSKGLVLLRTERPKNGEAEKPPVRLFLYNRCQLKGYEPS